MRFVHLTVFILFLSSCGSDPKPVQEEEAMAEALTETVESETEAATNDEKSPAQLQQEDEYSTSHPPTLYELEGTLGGKTPITLSMSFFKGFCFGHLTYTDVGTPIKIVGTHGNYSNYKVYEFADENDEATGRLELLASGRDGDLEIAGTWWAMDSSASYPLDLKRSSAERMRPLRPHTPGDGVYSVELGSIGHTGLITFKRNIDKMMIDAQLMGSVFPKGKPITTIGDIATEMSQDGEAWVLKPRENLDCHRRFYFVDQYAFVEHVSGDCGFGERVHFNDFYLREPIDPAFLND